MFDRPGDFAEQGRRKSHPCGQRVSPTCAASFSSKCMVEMTLVRIDHDSMILNCVVREVRVGTGVGDHVTAFSDRYLRRCPSWTSMRTDCWNIAWAARKSAECWSCHAQQENHHNKAVAKPYDPPIIQKSGALKAPVPHSLHPASIKLNKESQSVDNSYYRAFSTFRQILSP